MIKPIETRYKNYRFRSRLEARWAIFFDALEIKWQYEPEGFDLNGAYYLPDFYLPQYKIYAEIKPCEQDQRIIELLRIFSQHNAIILFIGMPNENAAHIFCNELDDSGGGSYDDENIFWMTEDNQPLPSLVSVYDGRERTFYVDHDFNETLPHFRNMNGFLKYRWDIEGVDHAIAQARSARFEHGENGAA